MVSDGEIRHKVQVNMERYGTPAAAAASQIHLNH